MSKLKLRREKGITLIALILGVIVIIAIGILIGNIGKKKEKEESPVSIDEEVQEEKEEYVYHMEDGSKLNVSEEMQKEKKVGNLKITNIQLKETKGITTLLADIENTGKTDTEEKILKIDILDKRGNNITTLRAPIDKIKAGEKIQLNTGVTGDVSNAYNFKVRE